MFDHVTIRVADRAASERFYATVLDVLGSEQTYSGEDFVEWGEFSLAQASAERPATVGVHVGFVARTRALVDEYWRTGTRAGVLFRDFRRGTDDASVLVARHVNGAA